MKLGILTAFRRQHRYYVRSCRELGVDHEVVDIIGDGWYERLRDSDCHGFLCRPPSKFAEWKAMYDERLWVLNRLLQRPIYPGLEELRLYENKRLSAYWLQHHGIPHSKTRVFYRKAEYMDFVSRRADLPFVTKVNTGSTGKGVRIVRSRLAARMIGHLAFGVFNNKVAPGYSPQTTGRVIPIPAVGTFQRHHILVQEYHPLRWEWRVVRIGESYFGHRKLLEGEYASGSRRKGWVPPPEQLLQLVRRICDTRGFRSMAVDIFETEEGEYLVNELQSIFGQSTDHLMYVDGRPGRYLYGNGSFRFQEGEFNRHRSFLLRVQDFIGLLEAEGPGSSREVREMGKTGVLFLCVGNSCRSQMAEGFARHLHGDRLEVASAGSEARGVDPRAVRVMAEAGVDISGQRSKTTDELGGRQFDYVITVCDPEGEACPFFPAGRASIHRSFPDPPKLVASATDEKEALDIYRRVRDTIREFVTGLPDSLPTTVPGT